LTQQHTITLNADAHGYGDACCTAWIAEGSRNAPVRLVHHATGKKRAFLEMLGQEVVELADPDIDAVTTFDAYEVEVHEQHGEIPRAISRGRELGITSEPKRPTVQIGSKADEFAAVVSGGMRRLSQQKRFVALWPQTSWRNRDWPVAYWMDLAETLKRRGYGYRFFTHTDSGPPYEKVDLNNPQRAKELRELRFALGMSECFLGLSWEIEAAIMRRSDLVVTLSSGPAWLAGTLDAPTLVIEGPTKDAVWSLMPSVETVRVGRQVVSCAGCNWTPPFRPACDQQCRALMALTPERVFGRIEQI